MYVELIINPFSCSLRVILIISRVVVMPITFISHNFWVPGSSSLITTSIRISHLLIVIGLWVIRVAMVRSVWVAMIVTSWVILNWGWISNYWWLFSVMFMLDKSELMIDE